jgi:hypothetical protein
VKRDPAFEWFKRHYLDLRLAKVLLLVAMGLAFAAIAMIRL